MMIKSFDSRIGCEEIDMTDGIGNKTLVTKMPRIYINDRGEDVF